MMLNGGIIFGLGRLVGLRVRAAAETALLLAASGEFAFVIMHSAGKEGLLDRELVQMVLVSSTLSRFCIPALAAIGAAIGRSGSRGTRHPLPDPAVVGYGRVGTLVAEMLTQHAIPWTAVEHVPNLIGAARREGHDVFFGDASRPELLQRFGLDTALAVVVTMDSLEETEEVVATARAIRPDLSIVARAHDAQQAQRLYEMGVSDAVPETIEASLGLSEALLIRIGVPIESVIASIHRRRDAFRQELNNPNASGGWSRRTRKH
jgi:CPA2 family monovalent cation:H+ antiporter-2